MNKLVETIIVKRGLIIEPIVVFLERCEANEVLSLVMTRDNMSNFLMFCNYAIKDIAEILLKELDRYGFIEFITKRSDYSRNIIMILIFSLINIKLGRDVERDMSRILHDFVEEIINDFKPLFTNGEVEIEQIVDKIAIGMREYREHEYINKLLELFKEGLELRGMDTDKVLNGNFLILPLTYNDTIIEIMIFKK